MENKEFLITEDIKLRRAIYEDIWLFYEWANDPLIRRVSFQTHHITKEEHMIWFEKVLQDAEKVILLGESLSFNAPVGYVRFESKEFKTVISIALDKKFRGQGYAKQLLKSGLRYFSQYVDERLITAYIKNENSSSKYLFTNIGFEQKMQNEEFGEYSFDLKNIKF